MSPGEPPALAAHERPPPQAASLALAATHVLAHEPALGRRGRGRPAQESLRTLQVLPKLAA